MPRAGLSTEAVVDAAADLVDREGPAALALSALASELGVAAPSLYAHIGGLAALEHAVALRGVELLFEACRDAVVGLSGKQALEALAAAYRSVALQHPGTYAMAQVVRADDPAYAVAAERLLATVGAVLSGYDLDGEDTIHAARVLRSTLHGFALLETQGGFGLDVDVDESFRRLTEMLHLALGFGRSG